MRNILIFSDYFFPGFRGGGPIRSIKNLCDALSREFNITVFTRSYDFQKNKSHYSGININQLNLLDGYKVFYSSHTSFISILKIIKEARPNLIYLNSFFSTLTIKTLFLKTFFFPKIEIILAPRGEFSPGALRIKKFKKDVYIKFFKLLRLKKNFIFHATDLSEENFVKSYFKENGIITIPNIPSIHKIENFKLPFKHKGKLKIVFISRISPKKNLEYAITCLNNIIMPSLSEASVQFDIYGVKEDPVYLNKCINLVKSSNKIDINFKNEVPAEEIQTILSKYHVFFLPTLGENFGHSIVESMQAGLIPLISDLTPWQDLEKNKAGWSISLESPEKFLEALKKLIDLRNDEFEEYSYNVKEYIFKRINHKSTMDMYKRMLNNNENL